MIRRLLLPALVVLAFTGCKKAETEPPPLPSASAAPAAAPAIAEVPTPEDFEQQAIDQINPQNMETELDKLEKEIGTK
jgi:hypothetical protein